MLQYRIILVFAGDLTKYICSVRYKIVHEQKTALTSNFLDEKRSLKKKIVLTKPFCVFVSYVSVSTILTQCNH